MAILAISFGPTGSSQAEQVEGRESVVPGALLLRYSKWQASLKEHKPKAIIFSGQGDIFFTPEGGESYLKDLPNTEMHRLLDYIAEHIHSFYDKTGAPTETGLGPVTRGA